MKAWQKTWLLFVSIIAGLHLLRDTFQSFNITNFLSTFLESPGPPKVPLYLYYTIYNTYIWALLSIILSLTCLKRNHFGKFGYATLTTTTAIFSLWLHYYVIL